MECKRFISWQTRAVQIVRLSASHTCTHTVTTLPCDHQPRYPQTCRRWPRMCHAARHELYRAVRHTKARGDPFHAGWGSKLGNREESDGVMSSIMFISHEGVTQGRLGNKKLSLQSGFLQRPLALMRVVLCHAAAVSPALLSAFSCPSTFIYFFKVQLISKGINLTIQT